MPSPPQILYLDNLIAGANKPSGWTVHPSAMAPEKDCCLMFFVRDSIGKKVYPVHRLDRPTSGLVLFALTPESAAALARQFAENTVAKHYLAIVRGWPPTSLTIAKPLKILEAWKSKKPQGDKAAQAAITKCQTLGTIELPVSVDPCYQTSRYSFLRVSPGTGRRHQIRRHLKSSSYPIIGDVNYGKGLHNRYFGEALNCNRMLLHAHEISFRHPDGKQKVSFHAPLEGEFARVVAKFGWAESTLCSKATTP